MRWPKRLHPLGQEGLDEAQLVQHLAGVGQEVGGRGLEHRHLVARGVERKSRGQAADPGAHDDHLHEILPGHAARRRRSFKPPPSPQSPA
ncbi:hypothetical protein BE20_00645 [Sorangium cellulosum]|nr:hypothetical protein BE20_00645 [Sorangium cellulosum]